MGDMSGGTAPAKPAAGLDWDGASVAWDAVSEAGHTHEVRIRRPRAPPCCARATGCSRRCVVARGREGERRWLLTG
eukprot:364818-Chlamydomonas_euryale.AAC.2